eukprot:595124-Pelagomonas_calceolata.AAC.6
MVILLASRRHHLQRRAFNVIYCPENEAFEGMGIHLQSSLNVSQIYGGDGQTSRQVSQWGWQGSVHTCTHLSGLKGACSCQAGVLFVPGNLQKMPMLAEKLTLILLP